MSGHARQVESHRIEPPTGLNLKATGSPTSVPARWRREITLVAFAGLAYFVAAHLSLGLMTRPDGVAVFWPAAGISSGLLIALGRPARWPILIGVMAAIVAANLMSDRNIWASCAFAVCNAVEAMIVSSLFGRYFGNSPLFDRLTQVLGLVTAAFVGTAIAGILAAFSYRLYHAPNAPMLTTWMHWFTSDGLGVVSVAPLVIGLYVGRRDKPPRRELIEGAVMLVAIVFATLFIVSLSRNTWANMEPESLLFPMLLWLAARCRPIFSAAGAFLISSAIAYAAIFGIGHFGDLSVPLEDRVLASQSVILFLTLSALVLAALFAERRDSEAQLTNSKMSLERERDNKFMGLEAVVAAISHELRQPLSGITTRTAAARRFLQQTPPNISKVDKLLEEVSDAGFRSGEVIENFRALIKKTATEQTAIDMNQLIVESLRMLRKELDDCRVTTVASLAPNLPVILGYRGMLCEVILNLVQNAIDAMAMVETNRLLRIETRRQGADTIIISIHDTGPGIDSKRLPDIFGTFVTTKPTGMGLGLAISRMIIEHHRGRLVASSDGATGALFQFVLPVQADDVTRV